MLMINNFRDREEDARCNKRTIVVCLGAGVGRWGYLALGHAGVQYHYQLHDEHESPALFR